MNSTERIGECRSIEEKAQWIVQNNRPPPSWPSYGEVVVSNICLKYSPDTEPILNNFSFKILGGETIGILGMNLSCNREDWCREDNLEFGFFSLH
jgi:ABC-type multidrug transport system fused ATPase/permease subunit